MSTYYFAFTYLLIYLTYLLSLLDALPISRRAYDDRPVARGGGGQGRAPARHNQGTSLRPRCRAARPGAADRRARLDLGRRPGPGLPAQGPRLRFSLRLSGQECGTNYRGPRVLRGRSNRSGRRPDAHGPHPWRPGRPGPGTQANRRAPEA